MCFQEFTWSPGQAVWPAFSSFWPDISSVSTSSSAAVCGWEERGNVDMLESRMLYISHSTQVINSNSSYRYAFSVSGFAVRSSVHVLTGFMFMWPGIFNGCFVFIFCCDGLELRVKQTVLLKHSDPHPQIELSSVMSWCRFCCQTLVHTTVPWYEAFIWIISLCPVLSELPTGSILYISVNSFYCETGMWKQEEGSLFLYKRWLLPSFPKLH